MQIKINKKGWFGLMFGQTMANTDVIVGEFINNQYSLTDRYSEGYSAPRKDVE